MSEENYFSIMLDNLNTAISQLEGGESTATHNTHNLEEFWRSLSVAGNSLSTEITKLCILYSKSPLPSISQLNDIFKKVEAHYVNMLKNFYSLHKEQGQVLRKKVQKSLLKLLESMNSVLRSLKEKGSKGQQDRMKLAGCVWESCHQIDNLPRNNLAAVCAELDQEQMYVEDALQEIEDEIKSQENGSETVAGEEIDNSERWSNQDYKLLPPCVALVKTARACMRRIKQTVQAQGRCFIEHEIAQLDDLASAVARLSPAVDDFVLSVYPPMSREAVKRTAVIVVNELQAILVVVKQGHYIEEEDQLWVNFLWKAVDHNNNKLQPLLTV